MHVLQESASIYHAKIDNSDEISLSVVQHIDECSIGGAKKVVKINATRMMDEECASMEYASMEEILY